MFDQRNQQFSTILLATTIMLSALVCCLAQGVLPNGSALDQFIYNVYSVSTSVSVAFLFLCLVFCIEVMWRASKFMYKRSKHHAGYLAKAIKKTKDMMNAIRGIKSNKRSGSPTSLQQRENDESNRQNKSARDTTRLNISKMTGSDVQKEFMSYEQEINHYHKNREAMIDDSAYRVTADDGSMVESKSFEKFWEDSCSLYGNAAVMTFYSGSAALFFANVTFMWSVNLYTYQSALSAKVCVAVVLSSLVVALMLLIYMRYIEKISMENIAADNDAEVRKYTWGSFRSTMATLSTSSTRLGGDNSLSRRLSQMTNFLGSSRSMPDDSESSDNDNDNNDEDEDNRDRDREKEKEKGSPHKVRNRNTPTRAHSRSRSLSRSRSHSRSSRRASLPVARSLTSIGVPGQGGGDGDGDTCPLPTADAALTVPVGEFDW